MASTLLEQARSAHEDNERLERIIVRDLQQEVKGHKERLYQNHRIKNFVDSIVANDTRLVEIYEDNDGSRKDEIAAIGGQTSTNQNVFSAFYDRLKEVRDYHRKHSNARIIENFENMDELIQDEPYVEFSGEEAFGHYLDLHENFNTFLNSKFGQKIEYSSYIDQFGNTKDIPKHLKFTKAYRDYLNNLVDYLISFINRTQPLQNNEKMLKKLEVEFDEKWEKGEIAGWENQENNNNNNNNSASIQNIIDLNQFDTVEELLDTDLVNPNQIKQALSLLGLKTGGTFQQRAERLLLTKDTPLEELDEKHFANKSVQKKGKYNFSDKNAKKKDQIGKQISLAEAKLNRLCELLHDAITETKANIEKKHALTYEEIEAEREDHEGAAPEENSDDEDEQIYNPLKLPMGWDGKPIPYWLYKLHGLGQEFKCEICGNYSYWGRRAFERHFKEWRHQHGMRCLGIPNTKNFNEITVIKDAESLWEKIKEKQGMTKWKPEVEEEYEDNEGNVYNKKTYLDLQRQGLI